jgi:hypothetical protein
MLRTLVIAAAATIALGTVALTPTTASARHGGGWHGGHHHHSGYGHRWHGPRYGFRAPIYAAYNPCLRKRWVRTPWGPQLRVINVCY